MDAKVIHEALLKISTEIAEINTTVQELKVNAEKRSENELLRRLEKIEAAVNSHGIKLDSLSAVDIAPVIAVPAAPATVRVAGGDVKEDIKDVKTDVKAETKADTKEPPKYLGNIMEFFKHVFTTDQKVLIAKGILSDEELKKVTDENKSKLDKKKNDLVKANSLAVTIWRTLPDPKKDLVYALKKQYSDDFRRKASTDIGEEKEK